MTKNKIVLVTGAGKGIGFETTKMLIEQGAFVYALVKDKNDKKKFDKFQNKRLKIYFGDVNDQSIINKIFLDSNKSKKIINCLVNNAGMRFRKDFIKIEKKEINYVFNTNFFSIFFLCQIFSKNLIKRKIPGSIVNIASIVGINGFKELSLYGSTKGALISLTKCLAVEFADKLIRVNSISPGFTKTSYYKKFKKNKKLYNWTISRIPMKRWGESSDISYLISFLLSDQSNYITGENFNVDGGWLNS